MPRTLGAAFSFDPRKTGLALALGAVGGWLFALFDLPLAWMLGAMCATTAAALAGMPVALPWRLRGAMVAILGIMLGSSFSPDVLGRVDDWIASLGGLFVFVAASIAIGYAYCHRAAGYDPVTSFFSAAPGGLSEMILVGGASGGDERTISLMHATRILIVVLMVPLGVRLLAGGAEADAAPMAAAPAITPVDAVLLAACAVVGPLFAHALRIPAAMLTGPMVLSAAIHLAGLTAAQPPFWLIAVAQVVVGTSIGCRFAGERLRRIVRILFYAIGSAALLIAVAAAFAVGLGAATGIPPITLFLAYAPGGLAEMSLVALSLKADPAFVSVHHLVRIAIIIVLAPLAFRLLARRRGAGAGAPSRDSSSRRRAESQPSSAPGDIGSREERRGG